MNSYTRGNSQKSSKMGRYTQNISQQGVPKVEGFGDAASEGTNSNSVSLPSRPASRVQGSGTQRLSSLPPAPASLPPRLVVPAGADRATRQGQLRRAIQQSMSNTSPSMSQSDWNIQSGHWRPGYINPRPNYQNVPTYQGNSGPGNPPHEQNVLYEPGNLIPGYYPHHHNVPTEQGHSGPSNPPREQNVPYEQGHSRPGYYPHQHNVPSYQGHFGPGYYPQQHNVLTQQGDSGFRGEGTNWARQQGPPSYQHLANNINLVGSNADPNGPAPYQGNLAQEGPAPYQGTQHQGGPIRNTSSMQTYANAHGYMTQPRAQELPFLGLPYFGLPPGDRVRVEGGSGGGHRPPWAGADNGPPYFGIPPRDGFELGAGRGRGRGQRLWMGSTPANAGRPQAGYQPRPRFNPSSGPDRRPVDEDDKDEEEDYEEPYDDDDDKEDEPPSHPSPRTSGIRTTNRRHLVALHEMYTARPRDTSSVKKYRVNCASPFRHLVKRGPAFKWACKELKVRDWEWDGIMERRKREFPGGFHMEWREDGTLPEGGNWYVVANQEGEGEGKGKEKWEERRDRINKKGGPRGGPGKRGNPNGFPRGGKRGGCRGGPRGGGAASAR